jgi:hypothetical protein
MKVPKRYVLWPKHDHLQVPNKCIAFIIKTRNSDNVKKVLININVEIYFRRCQVVWTVAFIKHCRPSTSSTDSRLNKSATNWLLRHIMPQKRVFIFKSKLGLNHYSCTNSPKATISNWLMSNFFVLQDTNRTPTIESFNVKT